MEGKNYFRTRWTQTPLFSGGNVVSLALPRRHATTTTTTATTAYVEALVMACGDVVHVVHSDSGERLCSFTLPVEDVILHLDAVTVPAQHEQPPQPPQQVEQATTTARQRKAGKRRRSVVKHEDDDDDEEQQQPQHDVVSEAAAAALRAPPGSYIAVGTRSLQLYVLRVDISATDDDNNDNDNNNNNSNGNNNDNNDNNDDALPSYACSLVQSWTAAQHAIALVHFAVRGDVLVSCSTDGNVKAWNVFHHHLTHNLRCAAAHGLLTAVHLDVHSRWLLVGSVEGYVSVFDMREKRLRATARPHVQAVQALTMLHDSNDHNHDHNNSDTTRKLHVLSVAQDRRLAVLQFDVHDTDGDAHDDAKTLREVRAVVLHDTVAQAVFDDNDDNDEHHSGDAHNLTTLHVGTTDGGVVSYAVSATQPVRVLRRLPAPSRHDKSSSDNNSNKNNNNNDSSDNNNNGATATTTTTAADEHDDEACVRALLVAHRVKGMAWRRLPHSTHDTSSVASSSASSSVSSSSLYVADAAFNIAHLAPARDNDDERVDGGGNKVTATPQYVVTHTLVGYLGQVLDVKLLPPSPSAHNNNNNNNNNDAATGLRRVVVTNSKDVRLYDAYGCVSMRVLRGHRDMVLCCAVSRDGAVIATAGKDTDVCFWHSDSCRLLARGVRGHTADVTSLAFSASSSSTYCLCFSVGLDEGLRLWDVAQHVLPHLHNHNDHHHSQSTATFTHRAGVSGAHAGAVYALAVSPNDAYVATGGKDKEVRLWGVTGKRLYREAALRGHRRAVAAVAFAPRDRVLASAAHDGAVCVWSLTALTCVRTLQVDKTAVLQLAFFNAGTQLVSGNADGVLRVWAVASGEVVWSGEAHDDKVWALHVCETPRAAHASAPPHERGNKDKDSDNDNNNDNDNNDDNDDDDDNNDDVTDKDDGVATIFVTGSADGVLVVTEDYTHDAVAQARAQRHETVAKEQALANAMREGGYAAAFALALQLSHPRHLRQVLTRWHATDAEACAHTLRTRLLPGLDEAALLRLLQFTREWMTNSRHCTIASVVTAALLASHHLLDLAAMPAMRALVEPLLAYARKHSQRQRELLHRTYYVDYITRVLAPNTLTTMPPFVGTQDDDDNNEASEGNAHVDKVAAAAASATPHE